MTPTRRPSELFDAASRRSDQGSDTIRSAAEAAAPDQDGRLNPADRADQDNYTNKRPLTNHRYPHDTPPQTSRTL